MPYILSPKIVVDSEIMWMEGPIYEKQNIYSIEEGKVPPVNYDLHKLKPHSITHAEGSLHVEKNGSTVEHYFSDPNYFYGKCVVIKFDGNNYKPVTHQKDIYHWEVSKNELIEGLKRVVGNRYNEVEKVIITTNFCPLNKQGYHNPNYVLTLSLEAAEFLASLKSFNMFGTSWKSSDFKPGSKERPIHKKIFTKAIIFELLDLKIVPEGEYIFVGFPIRLEGSSESPVTPVLFSKEELK